MLFVHQSNRLEPLAAGLARLMRDKPLGPLEPETVIVPSSGVGRWLSFALAEHLGISANVRHAFAAGFLWDLFGRILGDLGETSPFEPEVLRWHVLGLLGRMRASPRFARAERYLGDGGILRRYELALAISTLFDRYLVYRPDWIERWTANECVGLGPDEEWQAALWQEIAARLPAARTNPRERFFARLADDRRAREELPSRIHLFALAALPPLYLDVFRRLAEHLDVHVHALSPCRHPWGLIVQRRELALAEAESWPGASQLEVGNSLLASLGRHARAFFDALPELDAGQPDTFVEPGRASALATLQSDILDLQERGADARATLDASDDSIQVHVCHSRMREVEVLHDRLLDLFARNGTLSPSDVLVLVPQLEFYAPYIEAVFATSPARQSIRFSIADRGLPRSSEIVRSFQRLLELARTRLDAESVLALLDTAAIARRFGIERSEIAQARGWVRAAGVRWGKDETSRAALGLPATREHTWRAGFDRLLLGYAVRGEDRRLFAGILPYDEIEGGAATLVGRLKTFADSVFDLEEDLRKSRTARRWRDRLERMLSDFFDPDEDEARELLVLRSAVGRMAANAAEGLEEPLPLEIVERELAALSEHGARPGGFLGDGVTFAALLPERQVPARVIALLGLNDGAYPRSEATPGFDLIKRFPRRGDRVRRDEDRYTFLLAILAAREWLHLSYTGRSVRDNEPIPPSPLVTEPTDAVRRGFVCESGSDPVEHLTTTHRLQPFSPRYFDGRDPKLFTYIETYCARSPVVPSAFLHAPLPPLKPEESTPVTLEALARGLHNPARRLLRDRLGISLYAREEVLATTEPFELDALEQYSVRSKAFRDMLDGGSASEVLRLARARGVLPHGAVGDALFAGYLEELRPLVEEARAARVHDEPHVLCLESEIGAQRFIGTLTNVTSGGLITWHPAKLNAAQRLRAWLKHLVLQLAAPRGVARESVAHGLDTTVRFAPIDDAEVRLAALLALCARAACELLPFFPRASLAFAAVENEKEGMEAALREWQGNGFGDAPNERRDPYMELAFRGIENPLNAEFEALAREVYRPMLAVMSEDER